mmetsp:Transcript_41250/g.76737  ORF Transcript_41250/g.76737 Transcript_41250/m.76737 type:complete len:212 (+) Transcript_41250:125-760(+)
MPFDPGALHLLPFYGWQAVRAAALRQEWSVRVLLKVTVQHLPGSTRGLRKVLGRLGGPAAQCTSVSAMPCLSADCGHSQRLCERGTLPPLSRGVANRSAFAFLPAEEQGEETFFQLLVVGLGASRRADSRIQRSLLRHSRPHRPLDGQGAGASSCPRAAPSSRCHISAVHRRSKGLARGPGPGLFLQACVLVFEGGDFKGVRKTSEVLPRL